jgi:hypothetical protein
LSGISPIALVAITREKRIISLPWKLKRMSLYRGIEYAGQSFEDAEKVYSTIHSV